MGQVWQLKNADIQLEVLSLGAIIRSLKTKNKAGIWENIVLGFADLADYAVNDAKLGAIIGPYAGRIHPAAITLEGKRYPLANDINQVSIHGGLQDFSRNNWRLQEYSKTHIVLELISEAAEHTLPGSVKTQVCYRLDNNNLIVTYEGISTATTLWDPTQHTYWNLSGDLQDETIGHHSLQIAADYVVPLQASGVPQDVCQPVSGTRFDFRRTLHPVAQILRAGGLDHPFVLTQEQIAAVLKDERSGRTLQIRTDNPALVCYTGNHLSKSGNSYQNHAGICFETQHIPNSVHMHKPWAQVPLLYKNTTKKTETTFTFTI